MSSWKCAFLSCRCCCFLPCQVSTKNHMTSRKEEGKGGNMESPGLKEGERERWRSMQVPGKNEQERWGTFVPSQGATSLIFQKVSRMNDLQERKEVTLTHEKKRKETNSQKHKWNEGKACKYPGSRWERKKGKSHPFKLRQQVCICEEDP